MVEEFLSQEGEGFGISLVPGRTIMAWDFVNPEDAKAYDDSNRAGYLVVQRENEQAAVKIEAETQKIRSGMVVSQAQSTVESMKLVSNYLETLSPELRGYTVSYLDYFSEMEYLRQVDQLKPDVFFPPDGGPMTTYPVSPNQEIIIPSIPSESGE